MSRTANTPTREPLDETPLTVDERASLDVRLAAGAAAGIGVPLEQALAEVRLAYGIVLVGFARAGLR